MLYLNLKSVAKKKMKLDSVILIQVRNYSVARIGKRGFIIIKMRDVVVY